MWLEVLVGSVLGIIAGVTPGIHSNTFAVLLLLLQLEGAATVVIAAAVAYTIADIIPTTFLGVPDEETAVSILPAHQLVLEGRGYECVTTSVFSSLAAVFLSIPLFFSLAFLLRLEALKLATPLVLIAVSALLIGSERGEPFAGRYSAWLQRVYALAVFLASGAVGFHVLNSDRGGVSSLLMPMLTGFFAAPTLLHSGGSIPKQRIRVSLPDESVFRGVLAGFFVSLFPGISSGVATLVASFAERDAKRYVSTVSAANSANAVLCIFAYLAAGKQRSGTAAALAELKYQSGLLEVSTICVASAIFASLATLTIAAAVARKLSNVNARVVAASVFAFLLALIALLTGVEGLAVFAVSSAVGLTAVKLGVKRINCMGSLIIPVTYFYVTRI
ncbi:MAG: tripartite tricarboxylate transporter permease [Archaeoglobaceae archaeon]